MVLIDTNVISELMRPDPSPVVLAWFGRQDAMALHLSAVSEAEVRRGDPAQWQAPRPLDRGDRRDDL